MQKQGVTWDCVAAEPTAGTWRRNLGVFGIPVALAATVSTAAGSVFQLTGDTAPVQVGVSPWFADAWAAPDGTPTLPDLNAVEKVVKAQDAHALGGRGQGI